MKTRQILIDNETKALTPDAALLSIAAVVVEIDNERATILGRWFRRITLDQPGRSTTQDVMDWWQCGKVTDEARNEAYAELDRTPLHIAMTSLDAWLSLNPYPIWGNGADFDNAQLQHAFTQFGLHWPFWRNRCLRSTRGLVLDLHPGTKLPAFPADKIKHHALHDAEHEADVLAVLLDTIAGRKMIGTPVSDETEKTWRGFWEPIVATDTGDIDLGQIKRELHDYSNLLHEVPKVYMHITDGKVSKPHTDSDVVMSLHDDHVTELISRAIGEAA